MRHAVFLVLLPALACSRSAPPAAVDVPLASSSVPPVAAASPGDAAVTPAPLLIGDRLVDASTGAAVGRISGVAPDAQLRPLRDGRTGWLAGDLMIDGSGKLLGSTVVVEVDATSFVRYEPRGTVRWRVAATGVRSVRAPDAITNGAVAVFALDDRLHAFDDATGKPLWSAPGPADRLATDGTFVFVTDCTSGKVPARAIRALDLRDGKEAWRATLVEEADPDEITVDARHVVVRDASHKATVVLDHAGKELYRLRESVQSFAAQPGGIVFFTDVATKLVDDSGAVRWSRAPLPNAFVGETDVVTTSAGLLLGNYGRISDSGVKVALLDSTTGATKWETSIPGLGVAHSQYLHTAYLEVRGVKVFVVSQGFGGAFFERVDLATGAREGRWNVSTR